MSKRILNFLENECESLKSKKAFRLRDAVCQEGLLCSSFISLIAHSATLFVRDTTIRIIILWMENHFEILKSV